MHIFNLRVQHDKNMQINGVKCQLPNFTLYFQKFNREGDIIVL